MGCDYFADENGEFELEIWDYENPNCGKVLGRILLTGLPPKHRLGEDILKGDSR